MITKIKIISCLFLLLVFGLMTSCDDRTINPYEDEEGVFSIYGALDVDENRHVVRVRNLLEPFQPSSEFPINATVTFSNLQTGASTVLDDSIVQFSAGKVHNYILHEDLQSDTRYQLTVERSDGILAQTSITTPAETEVSYVPDKIYTCEEPIYFRFDNVKSPEIIRMDVGVLYQGQERWARIRIVGEYKYDPRLDMIILFMRPRNLLVEIFPPDILNPYANLYNIRPRVSCNQLDREFFMFRYYHFGPEWSVGQSIEYGPDKSGDVEYNTITVPFRNPLPIDVESGDIVNGLGFLGAYRTGTFSFEFQ
jgi:hypothetical protein